MFRFLKKKLFWLLAAVVIVGCLVMVLGHHERGHEALGDKNRAYAAQQQGQGQAFYNGRSAQGDHGYNNDRFRYQANGYNGYGHREHHEGGFGLFWLVVIAAGGVFFFRRKRRAGRRTILSSTATTASIAPVASQDDFLDRWEKETRQKAQQQQNLKQNEQQTVEQNKQQNEEQ